MKDYHAEISLTFSEVGEAENEEKAIQKIKEHFFNDYGLYLTDEEIKIELHNQE
jgi:N-acetylneuraminic acid mutarotase